MDFWGDFVAGVGDVPRNLPSMLIEVFGMGVVAAFLIRHSQHRGNKYRLAVDLTDAHASLLRASDVVLSKVKLGDEAQLDDDDTFLKSARELRKLRDSDLKALLLRGGVFLDNEQNKKLAKYEAHASAIVGAIAKNRDDGAIRVGSIINNDAAEGGLRHLYLNGDLAFAELSRLLSQYCRTTGVFLLSWRMGRRRARLLDRHVLELFKAHKERGGRDIDDLKRTNAVAPPAPFSRTL